MRRAVVLCLALAAATAQAAAPACSQLEGDFAFTGRSDEGITAYAPGQQPNIAAILFPDSDLVHDRRIDRYRIVFDQERVLLELHDRSGPFWRLDLAAGGGFNYCMDGALVIEQQRRNVAGSVYEYSRHRHVLRRDARGDLLVDTEITGKYRTWLMAWERAREHQAARFAPFGTSR